MKKYLFYSLMLASLFTKAQYKFYKDSAYSQPFSLLSGATQLIPGVVWDDPGFSAPIGFMFHMFNDSSTTIYNSEDFSSGCQLSLHPVPFGTDSVVSAILPLGSDLIDRGDGTAISQSAISYRTEGLAPNRIFKIQWKNAGFFEPFTAGNTSDSIDLQLWLYEGSDIIESRIGTVNLVSPAIDLWMSNSGPFVGIADTLHFTITGIQAVKGYNFSGPINNPSIDSFVNFLGTGALAGMTGNPISGMVFRFIPRKNSSGSVGYDAFVTYADPVFNYMNSTQTLSIELFGNPVAQYELFSLNGSLMKKENLHNGRNQISLEHFPAGLYLLRLNDGKKVYQYKILK